MASVIYDSPNTESPQRLADELAFLQKLFLGALAVRLGLSFLLAALDMSHYFAWDSYGYDQFGLQIAQYWKGESAFLSPQAQSFLAPDSHYRGFLYMLGGLYYLFGHVPLVAQSLICLAGAYTAIVVYNITATLYGKEAATYASLFTAYFPSLILWSSHLLRDPVIVFLITLTIYYFLKLSNRFSLSNLTLFIVFLVSLQPMRTYVFYIMAVSSLTWFGVSNRGTVARGLMTQAGTLIIFMALFSVFGWDSVLRDHFNDSFWTQLQVTRSDLALSANSGFGQDLDVSTPAGALKALPIGAAYLLLAPFPWQMTNFRQLMTLPEMLVWWSLLPAVLLGIREAARRNLRQALPILSFLFGLGVAYSVFQGNVGTAYRQRSQLLVLFFIFAGLGISTRRRSQQYEGETH